MQDLGDVTAAPTGSEALGDVSHSASTSTSPPEDVAELPAGLGALDSIDTCPGLMQLMSGTSSSSSVSPSETDTLDKAAAWGLAHRRRCSCVAASASSAGSSGRLASCWAASAGEASGLLYTSSRLLRFADDPLDLDEGNG